MNEHYHSPIVRSGVAFFAFIQLASAPFLGYVVVDRLLEARASTAWPSVHGQLARVQVHETIDGKHYVDVTYSYRVNGASFSGSRIDGSNHTYRARADAMQAIRGLAVGQPVAVFYRPTDPRQSLLRPGAGVREYATLLVPVGMSVFGLWLFYCWRGMRASAEQEMSDLSPDLSRPFGTCMAPQCNEPSSVRIIAVQEQPEALQCEWCQEHADVFIARYRIRRPGDGLPERRGRKVAFAIELIMMLENQESQFIYLRECGGLRHFNFATGISEVAALKWSIEQPDTPNPSAHALMAQLVNLSGRLESVDIYELAYDDEMPFYRSRLNIERDGVIQQVPARPSDAVHLAYLLGVPIMVAEAILPT